MIREYQVTCPTGNCGIQIKLLQPSRAMKLYCEKCNRILFPMRTEVMPIQTKEKDIASVSQTHLKSKPEDVNKETRPTTASSTSRLKTAMAMASTDEFIDDYKVIRKIGEGGMGSVFLAQHQKKSEPVVLKVLNQTYFRDTEKDRVMDYFIREAQVLLELNHPNIVTFKGCGNLGGSPYYVMEYIEGEELKITIQREGPMKVSQAISIVYRLAEALEYGLRFQLIHRDIKPANIILLAKNKMIPKLIDFGLAKNLGEHSSSLTQEGTMMGTPFYMPKEQIFDAKSADHRSDIYALGATFYFMLAGKAPYEEFAPQGSIAVMDAIVNQKLTPLEQHRPNIHHKIYEIISKSMEAEPGNRYASAAELKIQVAEFIKSIKK